MARVPKFGMARSSVFVLLCESECVCAASSNSEDTAEAANAAGSLTMKSRLENFAHRFLQKVRVRRLNSVCRYGNERIRNIPSAQRNLWSTYGRFCGVSNIDLFAFSG